MVKVSVCCCVKECRRITDGEGWPVLGSFSAVGLRATKEAFQFGGAVGDMPRPQDLPTPFRPDSVGTGEAQRAFTLEDLGVGC